MKEKKLSIVVILGAIICIIICILNNDSKLYAVMGGIAIGMQIMLIVDKFHKDKRRIK